MALRDVRRECEGLLRELDLPPQPTTGELLAAVSARRGRPLKLLEKEGAGEPCGAWISTAVGDYIFVDTLTSGLHRDHIAAHELAHVAFDHGGSRVLSVDAVEHLLPDLDPSVILKVLGRQSYGSRDEQQAEVFASLVLGPQRAAPADPSRPGPASPEVEALAGSLGARTPQSGS